MKQKQTRELFNDIFNISSIQRMLEADKESFNTMLDELPVCLWLHDENHTIIYSNKGFKEKFGTCQKQTCYQCIMREKNVCSCCQSKKSLANEKPDQCNLCKRGNCGYDINIIHMPITDKDGQKFILKSSLHIKELGLLIKKHFPITTEY
ncbi:MAG: hypothetical protein KKD01_19225 [Proteobacteria bacterium]|nr:hypothetical protein [Pseudomonadota bacterium]MBU1234468.1 hypothetical protein [Pseudomonadota bacterium]MBU1418465.1 hypothetical protein [Pseudomonadota bacterium]MBU1456854.1 hypothetical protein [Pseudomonadota bacterium]